MAWGSDFCPRFGDHTGRFDGLCPCGYEERQNLERAIAMFLKESADSTAQALYTRILNLN